MRFMKSFILLLCLSLAADAEDWNFTSRVSQTPEMKTYDQTGKFSRILRSTFRFTNLRQSIETRIVWNRSFEPATSTFPFRTRLR